MWHVFVPKPVLRGLARVPAGDERRIWAALDAMQSNPFGGNLKHLFGAQYRRRVGAYRIIFEVDAPRRTVNVKEIVRRMTTTYRER